MNRKLIYEQHHPVRQQPAHALAAELNATVRCAHYLDPKHRVENLKKLAGRFEPEERKILLGRRY